MQNKYLTEKTRDRGIVNIKEFTYKNGITLWQGDITRLDCDAIVNACNSVLLGCFHPLHNCIDNVIHSNAGVQVRLDCNKLMHGCNEVNGNVKVTNAYNLPSKYIFHTVGPSIKDRIKNEDIRDLQRCYISCLDKAREMELTSIAFCCISTGIFNFPKNKA